MKSREPDERLTNLFERHYEEVLAYCTRRVGRSDADDATAQVFAVAWRRIDEINHETVRPWLYGIARRVLANRWRSIKRQGRLAQKVSSLAPQSPEMPEVLIVRREEDNEVIDAIRKLSFNDREVLMLAAWEELTAREIGLALDISTSAAEQRLHRAKKRLGRTLKPQPTDLDIPPRAAHEGGGR